MTWRWKREGVRPRFFTAWFEFAIAAALPTIILLWLGFHTANGDRAQVRAEELDGRVAAATLLRREIELTVWRAGDTLRTLSPASTEAQAEAALSIELPPFADLYELRADGQLLSPQGDAGAAIASLLTIGTGPAPERRQPRVVQVDASGVGVRRDAESIAVFKKLANGVEAGFILHEASILRSAATILPTQLVATRSKAPAPLVLEDLAFTKKRPSFRDGPIVTALRQIPPSGEAATDVSVAPDLVVHLGMRDPKAAESRIAWQWRYTMLRTLFGVVSLLALAAAFFARSRRATQLAELRTDFVAAVSHELRTPLATVRMLAELLEAGQVEPHERPEVEKTLANETRRLGTTLDRMMRFGAFSRGRLTAVKTQQALQPVVAEAVRRHPRMDPQVDVDASIEFAFDAGLLGLVLDNLLGNAAKYASGPYLVRATSDAQAVTIAVSDHGPGLDRDAQARIFLPFERADNRLSRATEGTGIGLSLVRGIAHAHGGNASVASDLGTGSTFSVTLPRI